ncbi:MAG: hypothetical protein ACE5KV_07520, partial [Thermoplasmata archaeon]
MVKKEEENKMGRTNIRRLIVSAVSVFLVFAMVSSAFPFLVAGDNTRQDEEVILRIGAQDE